jgi:hypothetical protein
MPPRRFPPPRSVEELDACFVVRDHNGQALAYVYFGDEPGAEDRCVCRTGVADPMTAPPGLTQDLRPIDFIFGQYPSFAARGIPPFGPSG